jgi:hypothetical protein
MTSGPVTPADTAQQWNALQEENRRLRAALPAPPALPEPAHEDWAGRLPRHSVLRYETRPLADIRRLIIHQSGLPAEIGPEQVARYHVERRAWPGIGYHYFIRADGAILKTAPLESIAYHAGGDNACSAGICLAGRFDASPPTEAQIEATAALAGHLCGRLGIHAAVGGLVGHSEVASVECPGTLWLTGARWRDQLVDRIGQLQETGRRRQARAIGHYVLFWHDAGKWDADAWDASRPYIARFHPVCGFSIESAAQAEFVTVVGDETLFAPAVEDQLRAAGCTVERLAPRGGIGYQDIFDTLVAGGRRFLTLNL